MKLAVDVYYYDDRAKAVGILFENWADKEPQRIISTELDALANYEPGSFYKRELPCIKALLELIGHEEFDLVIVDGYVYLGSDHKPGLGQHLYEALDRKYPIIGVAKSYFHGSDALEVCRGESKNPLYITAIGIERDRAGEHIKEMYGPFRIPALLKTLDQRTKEKPSAGRRSGHSERAAPLSPTPP